MLVPLVILAIYVAWVLKNESARIEELEAQVAELAIEVDELSSVNQLLATRLSEINVRLSSLKTAAGGAIAAIEPPSEAQLSNILQGLYVLETTAQYDFDSVETSEYSITHVVVEIPLGGLTTKLHVGLAVSGWIPIGAYFDYNNDGLVDSDMAVEFVREIPVVGRRLARSYDKEAAQNLYSIFVTNIDLAEHTSPADLTDDAEAASNRLWAFVMNNYEAFVRWITEATQNTRDM